MNFFKFAGNREFVGRLTEIIQAHLGDEHFGVRELVRESGMSHSNVHRHLKVACKKSVSHFIRDIRLLEAMEMLKKNESTVAEIAYKVGFSSPTYFNCCFHDFYGFPPGEVRKHLAESEQNSEMLQEKPDGEVRGLADSLSRRVKWQKKFYRYPILFIFIILLILFLLTLLIYKSIHLIRDKNQNIENLLSFRTEQDKSLVLLSFGNFRLG